MENILYFKLNKKYYLFHKKGKKIKLNKVVDDKTCPIDKKDEPELKQIINLLCTNDISSIKNIKVLKNKTININSSKAITLSFTGKKQETFINNCKELIKKNKRNKQYRLISIIIALILLIITSYKLINKELMVQKYTIKNNLDINVEVVNIEDKGSKDINELESNLDITVWNIKYNESFEEFYSNTYLGYDFMEKLKEKNINNKFDLIYNCLLRYNDKIGINSSKEDMQENYIFNLYANTYIPYNNKSSKNKYIVFKGEKEGYAYITDKHITIELLNNDEIEKINFNKIISDEEIIELVTKIK